MQRYRLLDAEVRYIMRIQWAIVRNSSYYANNCLLLRRNYLIMKRTEEDLLDDCMSGDTIDRFEKNFAIIENPVMKKERNYPLRSNTVVSIIILSGSIECVVDMKELRIDEPGMLLILPSQIVERLSFDNGFRGYCFIMGASFLTNSMAMEHTIPVVVNIRKTGFYPMDEQVIGVMVNYMRMVQGVLRTEGNNFKREIIIHLTIAYYYGLGTCIHKTDSADKTASRYGEIADRFIELVRENCHIHRDMEFYSETLCLSAKHINLAVKNITGDNAMKWIERYTVLRAKSILKTTSLSISEIAYELNFPTPSDFGKYFKKFTGSSPKAFRNS